MRALTVLLLLSLWVPSALAQSAWYNGSWDKRMSFTPANGMVTENLSNVPLAISLNGTDHADIFTNALSTGADIRVTDWTGTTLLGFELAAYDSAASTAEIWVMMPSVGVDLRRIYLYYDNPIASSASTDTIWANYEGVYHYSEDPASLVLSDSSPSGNDGGALSIAGGEWGSGDLKSGQVGGAWQFGLNRTVTNNTMLLDQDNWTVSAWVYHDNLGTQFLVQGDLENFVLVSMASDGFTRPQFKQDFGTTPNGAVEYTYQDNSADILEWHQYTWVMDGVADVLFYYDGALVAPVGGLPDPGWDTEVVPGNHINATLTNPIGLGSTWFVVDKDNAPNGIDSMVGRVDEPAV